MREDSQSCNVTVALSDTDSNHSSMAYDEIQGLIIYSICTKLVY